MASNARVEARKAQAMEELAKQMTRIEATISTLIEKINNLEMALERMKKPTTKSKPEKEEIVSPPLSTQQGDIQND